MKKNVKIRNVFLFAFIAMVWVLFLQGVPAAYAQSQFMDYFTATPIIGSLSSNCWGAAAVGPRDQSNGLESQNNSYCYWDGGIIKGADGVYHMFASRWNESAGHMGWFGSVAVHATSNNLYGPYTDRGLCWPNNQSGKGHNVFPFVGGDGNYYIIVSDTRPGDIFRATSLDGPWTQLGTLSYSGNFGQTANICVMYRPDGRYMAVPRSGVIGISNNNVLGTYVVQGTSAYVQAGVPSGNLEDPVVWYSGGKYHIVVNKWDTRKAYHITSTDGINGWTLTPGLAYDPTANFIRYTNGTVNRWNKLERFNVYLEDGYVTAVLLSGIDVAKDADGGNDQHGSKVLIVPFDGIGLDGGEPPTPTPVPTEAPTHVPGTISIACGSSSDVGTFLPDQYFSGGSTYNNSNTVDVSQITEDTPPAALFNNERYGAMSYTIPGFASGNSFIVTLYFAETYLTSAGSRLFDVTINGDTVLSGFDLYASAGGQNIAIARSFTTTGNASGQIVIDFISGTENPKINGISIKPGEGPTNPPTSPPTPTPTTPPGDCNVFFNPANSTQGVNSTFRIDVVVDSGNQELAAYGFNITYDPSILGVVDVEEGADGFLAAANTGTPGEIIASGFDSSGTGPGSDLQVLIITFSALAEGSSTLGLFVDQLVDSGPTTIGTACGINGLVEVTDALLGDPDGDGDIDIVDALVIAQYYVDLDPSPFYPANADVDCDGDIDIVDALLVAQYYVDLISEFC